MNDYNFMGTPDLEAKLAELEHELAVTDEDDELYEQLEQEIEDITEVLDEREQEEAEIEAENEE